LQGTRAKCAKIRKRPPEILATLSAVATQANLRLVENTTMTDHLSTFNYGNLEVFCPNTHYFLLSYPLYPSTH
jgi:hypothetical protein